MQAEAGEVLATEDFKLGVAEKVLNEAKVALNVLRRNSAPEAEAQAKLVVAEADLDVIKSKLGGAEAKLRVAEDKLRVAGTPEEVADAKLAVAKAELAVAEAKWANAEREDKIVLQTIVTTAQASVATAQGVVGVATKAYEAAIPAAGSSQGAGAAHAGGQAVLLQEIHSLSRQIERMEISKYARHNTVSSSAHDATFNRQVVDFYQKGRCCFLSGAVDTGDGGNLPAHERVIAAHIIATADTNMLLDLNGQHPSKEFLTHKSPRNAILLQKKWEVLFDRLCWCLVPDEPFTQRPLFRVLVFAKAGVDKLSMLQGTIKNPNYDLKAWVEELQAFHHKVVEFSHSCVPSFRALSLHALLSAQHAHKMRWIETSVVNGITIFADLSPVHSPQSSEVDDTGNTIVSEVAVTQSGAQKKKRSRRNKKKVAGAK